MHHVVMNALGFVEPFWGGVDRQQLKKALRTHPGPSREQTLCVERTQAQYSGDIIKTGLLFGMGLQFL